MQNKDHYLLGCYLLEQCGVHIDKACLRMFLFGCIEPDWNLITYARGSVKKQFMHGHNAENAKIHLAHLKEKLLESGVRTPMQWFRFGVALHYLADSYTFAHNRIFGGNLKEHRLYEKLFHERFTEYLTEKHTERYSADEECHERYLGGLRSYETDCRYIVGTALHMCDILEIKSRYVQSYNLKGNTEFIWGNIRSLPKTRL